jgi:hypothetical protein
VLTSEEVCEDNVGAISSLVVLRNISKDETIQSSVVGRRIIDSGDWHEHDPRNDPDR